MLRDLIVVVVSVLLFTLGYGLCYYTHVKKLKFRSAKASETPQMSQRFRTPDLHNQLALGEVVKHTEKKKFKRAGKIEQE